MIRNEGYLLYWEALSGAIAPEMLLAEMGLGFRKIPVDMAAGEHRSPGYLAVNPTGQVPALGLPDGTVIGESAAIVLTIGERHPESALVSQVGDVDRPIQLYWLLYMATSMYMAFVRSNHPERFTSDIDTIESIRETALEAIDWQFGVIDRAIKGPTYFLTRGFSVLDIYLSMLTAWHPDCDSLFSRYKRVADSVHATLDRPACGRIMAEHLALA